jgi:molybdate transport system regulatory protein
MASAAIMKTAPLIRFRIDFAENSNVGPGKIALLEAIQAHGSVSAAARSMKLSYRRAWLLLESLNQAFTDRVSVNSVGGVGGGGVQITPFGALLIKRYREIEQRFNELANEYLEDIQARIKPPLSVIAKRVAVTKQRVRVARATRESD